jgi:hypothetical protein
MKNILYMKKIKWYSVIHIHPRLRILSMSVIQGPGDGSRRKEMVAIRNLPRLRILSMSVIREADDGSRRKAALQHLNKRRAILIHPNPMILFLSAIRGPVDGSRRKAIEMLQQHILLLDSREKNGSTS